MTSTTIFMLAAGPELPGGNRLAALVFAIVAALGATAPWYLNALGMNRRWRTGEQSRSEVLGRRGRRTPDDVLVAMHSLRKRDFEYVVASRRRRDRGAAVAATVAGLLVLAGLVIVATGAVASGIVFSLMGIVPGLVSGLYYSRAREADRQVETVRREIERIVLVESMESGSARDALVADLVRGSAGFSPSMNIHVESRPQEFLPGGHVAEQLPSGGGEAGSDEGDERPGE